MIIHYGCQQRVKPSGNCKNLSGMRQEQFSDYAVPMCPSKARFMDIFLDVSIFALDVWLTKMHFTKITKLKTTSRFQAAGSRGVG